MPCSSLSQGVTPTAAAALGRVPSILCIVSTAAFTAPDLLAQPAEPPPPSSMQPGPEPANPPPDEQPAPGLQPAPPDAEREPTTYPPPAEPLDEATAPPPSETTPQPQPQPQQPGYPAQPGWPQPYPQQPGWPQPYPPQPGQPAQPYPQYPYSPYPYSPYNTPPPPRPRTQSGYRHDGVFARISLGLGYTHFSRGTPEMVNQISASGLAPNFEVLAGGTITTGLVLGGGMIVNAIPSPSYKLGGDPVSTENSNFQLYVLPFFANYYFDPKKGFNVQALLGLGFANETVENVKQPDAGGIALGIGAGYEGFIAKQWSLGAFGRFTYANLATNERGVRDTYDVILPTISIVATLH